MRQLLIILALVLLLPLHARAQWDKAPLCLVPGAELTYRVSVSDGEKSTLRRKILSVDTNGDRRTATVADDTDFSDASGMLSESAIKTLSQTRYIIGYDSWQADIIGQIEEQIRLIVSDMAKNQGIGQSEIPELKFTTSSQNYVFPHIMSPGQKVAPGNIEVSMSTGPITIKITSTINRYECVGAETLTTGAGTFDTYIVESDTSFRISVMGIGKNEKTYMRIWYASGTGEIKRQTLNKRGKVLSESVLESITMPSGN